MFESPDAICFPSPIQPPPTTLQYNPSPRNIIFVHTWPAHSHFSFRYLLTAPTHLYILTQTKLLGVVGAGTPLGDQLLLHTAAIILI